MRKPYRPPAVRTYQNVRLARSDVVITDEEAADSAFRLESIMRDAARFTIRLVYEAAENESAGKGQDDDPGSTSKQ